MPISLLTKYGETINYTDDPISPEMQALDALLTAEYAAIYLQLEQNPALQADLQAEILKRTQDYLSAIGTS